MNKGSLLEPSFTQPLSTALRFLIFLEASQSLLAFSIILFAKNHWFAMCFPVYTDTIH